MADSKASPQSVDLDSPASWEISRSYASLLNPIPPVISTAIQYLWADHLTSKESGTVNIRAVTMSQLRMIERSGKLKAPVYFAALALFPEKMATPEDDTVKALLSALGPGMFAAVLAMVYLHRRLNKICTDAQWDTLSKEMVLNMELGFLCGSSVPKLGTAEGTLAGGIRYAALATFLIRDPDQFMRYRNLKRRQFDMLHEHSLWQCDHAQMAAYALKELGFTSDLRKSCHALRKLDDNELCALPNELTPWRAALKFIDTIKTGGDPAKSSSELKITDDELANLKAKTEQLFKGKTAFGWMFKASKSEEKTEEKAPEV